MLPLGERRDNLWITDGEPLVEWIADLGPPGEDPARLLGWLRRVLAAGRRHQVGRGPGSALAGYQSERDGDLISVLQRR
jgi:hypothetical protein